MRTELSYDFIVVKTGPFFNRLPLRIPLKTKGFFGFVTNVLKGERRKDRNWRRKGILLESLKYATRAALT